MARYFINGRECSRREALKRWEASTTYANARYADAVFSKAERGDLSGGVTEHLAEAGIRIERSRFLRRSPHG